MNHSILFRSRLALVFLSAATLVSTALANQFEGWRNKAAAWGTTIQAPKSSYAEGRVIPFRFIASLPAGTVHKARLAYDFSNGTSGRFFDYLQSYDTSEAGVRLSAGITLAADQLVTTGWQFPVDSSLPVQRPGFIQPPGLLSTCNISTLSFTTGYSLSTRGAKEISFTFTVAGSPGSGNRTVLLAFGGHLATEMDWGTGGGASQFPGSSRRAYLYLDSLPALYTTVSLDALVTGADLSSSIKSPPFACPDSDLIYEIKVGNAGPNSAANVAATCLLPPGVTYVSSTTSAGVLSGTGPLMLSIASLAPGASSTVVVRARVDSGGNTPLQASVSLSSTTADPSPGNNSAVATTSTADTESPQIPVPADCTLDVPDGQCDVMADYTAARVVAVDNCSAPLTLTYAPPSGSLLAPGEHNVVVTATDAAGNSSSASFKVFVRDNPNVSWPAARPLNLASSAPGLLQATFTQCLSSFDQSRWYRFPVKPGNRVAAILSSLPQNYDLVLFKDIREAYESLTTQSENLPLLNAQFAADAFSPAAFSPDALSPAAFSPAAFSPAAFSPAAFSPAAFSPAAFSPAAFSPTAFSPDAWAPAAFSPTAFSPTAFSPTAFSPAAFSPAAFSPAAFSPTAFSPAAFSDAQIRSVIAASAFPGTASEGVMADTWNNDGDFYIRVRGRNGVFDPGIPFELTVYVLTGACESVQQNVPALPGVTAPPEMAGQFKTLILTDSSRLKPDSSTPTMNSRLAAFAGRPEVQGRIVDLAGYPQIGWLNSQADSNYDCPFARNLVAAAIRNIIDRWRSMNPVENIVLIGADDVIPFFRYPDQAMLGPENNYVPPLREFTASQAALRLNFVLGQDAYGSLCEVQLKSANIPLPDIPVGRLVESPSEISGMLQAYLDTQAGVIPTPSSALVTGYDFLTDAAHGVRAELEAGLGHAADLLIDPGHQAPAIGWTADQLRALLFGSRHDLVFLAGHFSAFSALAADYQTVLLAEELATTPNDFKNSILFSAGCHSGYNAVDAEGIPGVTPQPDWAQAAARRQATLIAGTGYQYGDTDFIAYGEQLYLTFAAEFRKGSGPVSVGQALIRAKRKYLAQTPVMRGIHEKSFLQTTLFGLPMLSVNMPAGRVPESSEPRAVGATTPVETNPGKFLGLHTADLSVEPEFTTHSVQLQNIEAGGTVSATYLEGSGGILVNPAEPVLPLETRNVTVPNTTLRGVGWRGGTYVDMPGIIPLTGAATTEIRGVHATFLTDVLYPVRLWSANYFDAVCGIQGDVTRLHVWPAQFVSDNATEPQGTLRRHSRLDFRLFYSNNRDAYLLNNGSSTVTPALAAPPSISGIFSSVEGKKISFGVHVTGDPAAGIQEVWITYTSVQGVLYGRWIPVNLVQDETDSTLWRGELDLSGLNSEPADIRYVVQAVNGVGLVTLSTQLGDFHQPGQNNAWPASTDSSTRVELVNPPPGARFGDKVNVTAIWTSSRGESPGGRPLVFTIGEQQVVARTDSSGRASATFNLLSPPGSLQLRVGFEGASGLKSSSTATPFTLSPAPTSLILSPSSPLIQTGGANPVSAQLSDQNGPLIQRTVLFVAEGSSTVVRSVITDLSGKASLGTLPTGNYNLTAYFGARVTLPDGSTVLDLRDSRYSSSSASALMVIDSDAPVLLELRPSISILTLPNHKLVPVAIQAAFTDNSGIAESRIVQITSNEPDSGTGPNDIPGDYFITGPLSAKLRAERSDTGTGRIYTLLIETSDAFGNKRLDEVTVLIPR